MMNIPEIPIEVLNFAEQWPNWIKRVTNRLVIKGYNYVLQAEPTVCNTGEDEAAFQKRIKKWSEDMTKLYAEIDNLCSNIASSQLAIARDSSRPITEALKMLEDHFRGNTTNIYQQSKAKFLLIWVKDYNNDPSKLSTEVKKPGS